MRPNGRGTKLELITLPLADRKLTGRRARRAPAPAFTLAAVFTALLLLLPALNAHAWQVSTSDTKRQKRDAATAAAGSGATARPRPARPRPPRPTRPGAPVAAVASVQGSAWEAEDSDGDRYTFDFHPGGLLRYTFRDEPHSDGTWQQSGRNITMRMGVMGGLNFTGTISGSEMSGRGSMPGGHTWTWDATRTGLISNRPTPPALNLANTTWAGTDSDGDYFEFEFRQGGALTVRGRSGSPTNGNWRLAGSDLSMTASGLNWRGTVRGNAITGTGSMQSGHTWRWTITPLVREAANLAGTTWTARDSDGDNYVFHFLSGGTLRYNFRGRDYTDGTWTQNGNNVAMRMNALEGMRQTGVISGNQMQGTGSIGNHSWTWSANRTGSAPGGNTGGGTGGGVASPLIGTTWSGIDSDGDHFSFTFQPNGRLLVRTPQNEVINGTWSASGNTVRMSTSSLRWQGTIQGNQMRGTGQVIGGNHTWTFTLTPGSASGGGGGGAPASPVINTTWALRDSDNDEYTLTFLSGGRLRYTFNNQPQADGSWTQNGNNITMILGGFRLTGTFSGNQMEGRGAMSSGHTWTWRGTRISGAGSSRI